MNFTQILALIVFISAYALIATERIPRTAAALGGAGLMLALGLTDGGTAYQSPDAGIDWNVIFLLLGMMIIVGVIKQTGCSSSWRSTRSNAPAVGRSRSSPSSWSSPRSPRPCSTTSPRSC